MSRCRSDLLALHEHARRLGPGRWHGECCVEWTFVGRLRAPLPGSWEPAHEIIVEPVLMDLVALDHALAAAVHIHP